MKKIIIVIILLSFSILGCTKLNSSQKKTISTHAQHFIKNNSAPLLPLVGFNLPIAQKIRKNKSFKEQDSFELFSKKLNIKHANDTILNVPLTIITPQEVKDTNKIILFVHGGAFLFGTDKDYLTLKLGDILGLKVISINYSLSPEVKFPVALNEVYKIYKYYIRHHPNKQLIFVGGSAGGNLVLSTILKAQQESAPMPWSVLLFSPWCDLSNSGDSYRINEKRDSRIRYHNLLDKAVKAYIKTNDSINDPYLSPINGDYKATLPPTIIISGTRDLFLSSCILLSQKLKLANEKVVLNIYEGMWHSFTSEPNLPEAENCFIDVANFLSKLE